jgi:CRP/FNR family transcriptional regulator
MPAARTSQRATLAALDRVGTVMLLRRHDTLFYEGDAAECCYKVVAGTLRSCRLLADGRRHINEFLMPGDYVALEAGDTYGFTAEAVSDVTLMRYPRAAVERLMQQQPLLGKCLLGLVCGELCAAQERMLLLGRMSAVERLASFLLMMLARGGGEDRVALPMTRSDIADFLGLTMETVSRTLGQLKSEGVIGMRGAGDIIVPDRGALEDLAEAA